MWYIYLKSGIRFRTKHTETEKMSDFSAKCWCCWGWQSQCQCVRRNMRESWANNVLHPAIKMRFIAPNNERMLKRGGERKVQNNLEIFRQQRVLRFSVARFVVASQKSQHEIRIDWLLIRIEIMGISSTCRAMRSFSFWNGKSWLNHLWLHFVCCVHTTHARTPLIQRGCRKYCCQFEKRVVGRVLWHCLSLSGMEWNVRE